jgi:hypothetical protein
MLFVVRLRNTLRGCITMCDNKYYDRYEGEMDKLLREIANEGSADSMEVDTFMKSLGLDPEKNK